MILRLHSHKYVYLVLLLFCCVNSGLAQDKDTITLSQQLNSLEKKYNVIFSYNHSFFDTIILENNLDCKSLSECIDSIEKSAYITITNDNLNNYIVVPQRKTIQFKLQEDVNEYLQSVKYQINKDEAQSLYAEGNTFTLSNIHPLDSITLLSYFHKSIKLQAKELMQLKTIQFNKKQFYLNQIVLNSYITKGVDVKLSDHSLQINTQDLSILAGETDGDLYNVMHNIPGIHSPSSKSGNLYFRGNTYDQNLIQIDDIPIYHSGHFLGAISPYNSSVITNVEVQRNMLPAKYGGRVGGLISMTTSSEIPDSTKYEVALNTLFGGATIKSKLIEDKLSLYASFRSSYPEFNTPKLKAISTLIFQGSRLESIADEVNTNSDFKMNFLDINAKLNYNINDKHTLSLSYINIQNNLSAEIKSNTSNDETDFRDLELDNWGITTKWKAQFNEKLSTELRFSKSNMNLISISQGFVLEERSRLEKYDNTISDTRLIAELNYDIQPGLGFEAGYSLTNHQLISNEVEQENNINSKRDQKGTLHENYFSFEKNWNDKLTLNFGFHNNYFSTLKKFYINPRISTSYAISNVFYLKSSFGTSNQFIQKKLTNDFDDFNITNQLWFLPNEDIRTLKSTQIMFGSVYDKNRWLIDLELYHKNTNNITNKSDGSHGSISSLGGNLFIKRRWNKLETWVSYALSKTQTDFNNTKTDAFFDQRHIINLTGLINLNNWKFAITWGYYSGMPIIYPDETDSNNLDPIPSDRFDALHQLDFSSTYTFFNASKRLKTVIGLSILNLYNQDNTVNIFQNTTESTFRKASEFAPNLQVNLFF